VEHCQIFIGWSLRKVKLAPPRMRINSIWSVGIGENLGEGVREDHLSVFAIAVRGAYTGAEDGSGRFC
jgi:hypothetical protein